MAYTAQQQLDGYDAILKHAQDRKKLFDRWVLRSRAGEVVFVPGQLVQTYRSDMDYTFKSDRRLIPKWSPPHRIVERLVNSYRLETLGGEAIDGLFHSRRLREFVPREGTKLFDRERNFTDKLEAVSNTDHASDEDAAFF